MTQHQNDSPYARVGANLIDQGYAAIPCRPGFKVPGVYGPFKGWANQMDWTQFCDRLPTDAEIEKWSKWPDAGVCIALGFNDVVAVDIDSDDPAVVGAIEAALGDLSWVQKAGRKGYTSFYRAGPAVVSRAFSINGERVLDLLCKGKQTVIPPTIHPDTGEPYRWVSGTLEHVSPENLPMLPDDIAERLSEALKPLGYQAPVERSEPVGDSGGTWREVNDAALANLDAWVPHLGIDAKRNGSSWRGMAKWRNGDGMNVGFHPTGIKDWGDGDKGMSAIDVVMLALEMDFGDAVDWLKRKLGIEEPPRLHFNFRKAGEGRKEEEEVELIDSTEIMRMIIGAREEMLALADPDDAEDVAWLARMRQEIAAFSEGVMSARERFPADVFERHFIAAAVVAVGDKLDKARDLGFAVEVSHIVGWIESAINALQSEPEPEVGAEGDGATEPFDTQVVDPFNIQAAGGLLQQTAEWIMSTSFVPSRELSLIASIGIMAAFMSRRYVGPTGLSPNLYLVGLASTGAGKDAPLAAVKTVFLGHGSSIMRGMLGAGDLTSGPAIQRLVRARAASISPIDEIGAWMQDGAVRNAAAFARTRRKALLELYTISKRGGIYLGRDSAGEKDMSSDTPIHSPCFSILGMSTEKAFFNGLTEENLSDGYLNRLTMIYIPPVEERRRRMEAPEMPHSLKMAFSDAFEKWSVKGSVARGAFEASAIAPRFHVVPYADGAEAACDNVWDRQQALIKADPGSEGVIRRAAEQALKLAMIRAVSRDFAAPAITVEDVAFGEAIVFKSIEMLLDGIKRYMSGSDFEEACKAMLHHVEAAGAKGLTAVKLRRRSGVSKLRPKEFDEAAKHLTDMGDWRPVKENRGVRYFSI